MLAFLVDYGNLICMEMTSISDQAQKIIDSYKNFSIGNISCSVPYFNNKVTGRRAGLKVETGKGAAEEILDEIKTLALKQKIDLKKLTGDDLKKLLVDNNFGIDCSGFAYYILEAEGLARGKKSLKEYLKFPASNGSLKGVLGKIRSKIRPIENAGVKTFAYDENSKVVDLVNIKVGDVITMIGNEDGLMRDHILIVTKVEYQNSNPKVVYYVHSVAWPTDGEYGHGIHEGRIEITDINKSLLDQRWVELEKEGLENYTYSRANKSKTEIRRLNWF